MNMDYLIALIFFHRIRHRKLDLPKDNSKGLFVIIRISCQITCV